MGILTKVRNGVVGGVTKVAEKLQMVLLRFRS